MSFSPESIAALFERTAFVSALLGGFCFTFLAVLLTAPKDSIAAEIAAALAAVSAIGFIVCAVGWTLAAPHATSAIGLHAGTTQTVSAWLLSLHKLLSMCFIVCLFCFMVCIAFSGWIRSRKLGFLTSISALLGSAMVVWILAHVTAKA